MKSPAKQTALRSMATVAAVVVVTVAVVVSATRHPRRGGTAAPALGRGYRGDAPDIVGPFGMGGAVTNYRNVGRLMGDTLGLGRDRPAGPFAIDGFVREQYRRYNITED